MIIREICVFCVILLFIGVFYLNSVNVKVPEAYTFPLFLLYVMIFLSFIHLINVIINFKIYKNFQIDKSNPIFLKRVVLVILSFIFYLYLLRIIGFYSTSFLLFFILKSAFDGKFIIKKVIYNIITAGLFIFALFILFSVILKVYIPKGLLGLF